MLLLWGCHRDDWYDEPVPSAVDEDVGAARRRVAHEVERTAEALGERLPEAAVAAFRLWCGSEG